MTTRRQFLVIGGAALGTAGLAGRLIIGDQPQSAGTLVIRQPDVPLADLPAFVASGEEAIFAGDYGAMVSLANRHFSAGGQRLIAAIDNGGSILLTRTLRAHPAVRVAELVPPQGVGQKFTIIVAETVRKA